jgi:hypothetical protein
MNTKKRLWMVTMASLLLTIPFMNSCKDENNEIISVCPEVVSTSPDNLQTNMPLDQVITATFNVEMDPETFSQTSFTVQSAPAPAPAPQNILSTPTSKQAVSTVTGAVTYEGLTATFRPSSPLDAGTTYICTIEETVKDLMGNALQVNYVWTFSTGAVIVPVVASADPDNLATGVNIHKAVSINFSMPMNPLSFTESTFTLVDDEGNPVDGEVSYSGTTAKFTPASPLSFDRTYTATISADVVNMEGTPIAEAFVWSFATVKLTPMVTLTVPEHMATNVSLDQVFSANFSMEMNPLTISDLSFLVYNGATQIEGLVEYAGTTATFKPNSSLEPDKTYTATITTAAQNLAGTAMANNFVWSFATGEFDVAIGPGIIDLGNSGDFAILAKTGISTTGNTLVTGHIGVSPIDQTAITGFSETMDASGTFSTSIYVVGRIFASDYLDPTPTYVSNAVSDQETAFVTAMGLTTDVIVDLGAGDISGMTLAPALYKWGTGLLITNEGVTLAGGPNDTWVFQISDDFTIQNDAIITLTGGAQAKNVFWITSTQALIGSNVQFRGNILAQTLISITNGTTVVGRLLSQSGVTLDASTVSKP